MRLIAAVVCAALLGLAPSTSRAQSADDQEAAKAHFLAGSAYYEQANYADAVKELSEAYRLSKRPDLLYNLALAYERLEQYDKAIAALKQYLDDKKEATDRGVIEERIQHLTVRHTTVTAARPRRFRHTASLVVGSVGVAILAAALGTGVASDQIHKDLDRQCPNMQCPDTSARGRVDDGRNLQTASDVLLGIGAATVATSLVLLIIERKAPASQRARLAPAAGGLLVRF
jgi:tetratricopeptide (TPR) repeat protein